MRSAALVAAAAAAALTPAARCAAPPVSLSTSILTQAHLGRLRLTTRRCCAQAPGGQLVPFNAEQTLVFAEGENFTTSGGWEAREWAKSCALQPPSAAARSPNECEPLFRSDLTAAPSEVAPLPW